MTESFSEPSNLLLLGLAVLIGAYILFKVAGKIIKTVLFFALVGLVIYFWRGGTADELKGVGIRAVFPQKTTISGMMAQLCADEKAEKTKCTCIVQPVYADLSQRLTAKQIAEIDANPEQVQEEIRTSLENRKKEIQACLVKNKGSQYMEALKEVIGKANEVLQESPAPADE